MRWILLFLPCWMVVNSYSQSIEFSAKASKQTVAADEPFKLIYSVNVEGEFTLPDLKDFKLLSGPSQSSYSQIQIINGQMKNSVSLSWVLIVRPKKEGEFTVPPAGVTYKGKVYKSNSIKITVTAATGNQSANPVNPSAKTGNKNMFCLISVNKNSAYVGEPLQVIYKLYLRSVRIEDYDIKIGTQKDVWSHEIPGGKGGWPSYEETVNGIRYMVYPLRKEIIIPQKSGNIKLEPFDMMAVVRVNYFETQRIDLISNSPELEIKQLPSPIPASFSNAVGKYSLEAKISKEEVSVNDGIDITLKLSGSGNIRLVDPEKFTFPADFEVYDPEVNDKTAVNATGVTGSKEYKYLVIPRHSGKFKIEPIKFTYFDLDTKNYVTLSTPEFNVNVKKGEGDEDPSGFSSGDKEELKILDKEIRYLKKYESLSQDSEFFTGTEMYFAGVAAPPVLLFLFLMFRKRKEEKFDPLAHKEKKASRAVIKQLQVAHSMLVQNNHAEFYTELLKGLQQYYCDKFHLKLVDFNRQTIRETFVARGISEEIINEFLKVVDNCEMARYASFMKGNEQETYTQAAAVINRLEQEVAS